MIFSECTCAVSEYVVDLLSSLIPTFICCNNTTSKSAPYSPCLGQNWSLSEALSQAQTTPEVAPVASEGGGRREEGREGN